MTDSKLLADPAQVALVRDLYAHARSVRAEHATYSFGNGLGQPMAPQEHTWTAGENRVSYEGGELRYLAHGVPILRAVTADVRQVGQLLAAIGVLPGRFAAAAAPSNPDRRCRICGATSGLVMLHSNPLVIAPTEWECAAGCADEQSGR